MAKKESLAELVTTTIGRVSQELEEISLQLHANPELSFEEVFAHQLLTSFLKDKGFSVTPHYKELRTAFRASVGHGKPTIAVMCEYDALPGIGHACGHNLIAVSALAVALGIQAAFQSGAGLTGTLVILGTPAEENGSGKVLLIERGAFDDIDVALMVHPTPFNAVYISWLALHEIKVTYNGKSAHASVMPYEGINALDAVVAAYNNISFMRQQIRPTDRVHGVITEGGERPNIIPSRCSAHYYVRSKNRKHLQQLKTKVMRCFEAAANATGCSLVYEWIDKPTLDVLTNDVLAKLYVNNFGRLGGILPSKEDSLLLPSGSTDFGNVSYTCPSIHPLYEIPCKDDQSANHTPEFTISSASAKAHAETWRASKALALTAIDLFLQPDVVDEAKREFKQAVDVTQ